MPEKKKPTMTMTEEQRKLFLEACREGGLAAKAGGADYHELGRLGGAVTAKRGKEFYQQIGRQGGSACRDKRGVGFYQKIGAKGNKRFQELVARGKQLEKESP